MEVIGSIKLFDKDQPTNQLTNHEPNPYKPFKLCLWGYKYIVAIAEPESGVWMELKVTQGRGSGFSLVMGSGSSLQSMKSQTISGWLFVQNIQISHF